MMAEWQQTQLGQVCRFKSGDAFKKERQGNAVGAVPFVKVSDLNLVGNEISINRSNNWISDTEAKSYNIHPVGAVLFAKIGIALTYNRRRRITRPTVADNNLMSAIPKTVDSDWLYYLLCTLDFNKISSGSALPYLTVRDLAAIDITVPPPKEQQAVAGVLSALDNKIELNRRMNETLEASARALFRDWFVDFGPTRAKAEGRPAYLAPDLWSLFPDRLSDDGVPESWNSYTLGDLAQQHTATINPDATGDEIFEHYSLPAFDAGHSPALDSGDSIKSNKTMVPAGAVLLSKLSPEISRVWVPNDMSGTRQIASTEFLAFVPKPPASRSLLFALFRDDAFRQIMEGMVTGTSKSHQRISPPALRALKALVGSSPMFKAFDRTIAPMIGLMLQNRAESQALAATRDALLPKLMSGELRVGDAEALAA